MYSDNDNEDAAPTTTTTITLKCQDEDCPGHLAVPTVPGLHRFRPCDHCPWSYDVRVWILADGRVLAAIVASHAPGSSASFEPGR